jgi:hypothetical protein
MTLDMPHIHDIARKHYPDNWQGAGSESCDLLMAASKMTVPITDSHLIDWKRGRGMASSADMSNKRKREAWLRFAREIITSHIQSPSV